MIRAKLDHGHHAADRDAMTAMDNRKLLLITDIGVLLLTHKEMANLLRGSDETWNHEGLS